MWLNDYFLPIIAAVLLCLSGCKADKAPMTDDELSAFATRYAAAWSSRHSEEFASFYSKNGTLVVNDGTPSVGREAIAATAESYMTAFPDMVVRMDSVVPTDSGATFHWTWTGTNTGPGGTGRSVRLNGFEVWTFDADGLISLSDGHFDQAEYERQMSGTFTDGATQYADESFVVPDGKKPRFTRGAGPVVGIDEAHHNYHTAEGRYLSFANLLRNDGYRVKGFSEKFTAGPLENVDVLVVSNALSAEKEFDWSLPTPPAFEPDEVAAVADWVRTGGRLMLIADHMPFPGAAANLAEAFGVTFNDAYAYRPGSFD
ncbi:MAG: nuclear transport factor 2 family protein, partial [Rhodothermales bacterium]